MKVAARHIKCLALAPMLVLLARGAVSQTMRDTVVYPQYVQYPATITVVFPYDTVLVDERVSVRLEVKNCGNESIRVTDDANPDLFNWDKWRDGRRVPLLPSGKTRSPDSYLYTTTPCLDIHEISPGQTYVCEQFEVGGSWALPPKPDPDAVEPILFLGKNRFARGVPTPLRILRTSIDASPRAYSFARRALRDYVIHEAEIEGERYLFTMTGSRFCRIPGDTAYTITNQMRSPYNYVIVDFGGKYKPLEMNQNRRVIDSADPDTVPWLWAAKQRKAREKAASARPASAGSGQSLRTPQGPPSANPVPSAGHSE